MSLSP